MNKEKELELIELLQKTVEQMRIDDIEELTESAFENFQCHCCGKEKMLAGSLLYTNYLLCNECVLMAEIGFALNKIKNIDELIEHMKEKKFENVYNSLFEEKGINN